MELIRGKTFIKSYAHHPPEKVPTVVYKGKKNVEFGKNFNDCDIRGKTFIKNYTQNPPEKVPTFENKEKKNVQPEKSLNECDSKKNAALTHRMSNGIFPKEDDNVRGPRFIRKSKTHDCVIRNDKPEKMTSQSPQGQITNSLSSPGLVDAQGGKRNEIEATKQASCKQNIIDYRNFVPQMPFVPSVAKSLPRKRISLRKSKKSLKNIFNLRKNKQQDIISEDESQPIVFKMKQTKTGEKQHQLSIGEMASDEFLLYNCSDCDMYIDSVDSLKALCEDVASLKSFDSLTGCGEIFADESASFIDIENSRVTFISKTSSIATSFQGGVERLASPAKSESIDFSRLCSQKNSSARSLYTNVLPETKMLPVCQDINEVETNSSFSRDQVSNLSFSDLTSSNENIHDAESPMSTSDEGYYDSYSPGLEEDKNVVGNGRPFPRDSYSGDALYELISDTCEKKPWPSQDCDLPAAGHSNDNPTSIYSFCVGSEENMTSQPVLGFDGEDSNETTLKGRECLLKLCETELSLTIGMVNWLKKTGQITETDLSDQNVTCKPKEPKDMKDGASNKVEETVEMFKDSKEEKYSHWEFVRTEHTEHVNSMKMATNKDSVTSTLAEVPKSTTDSDERDSENNSPSITQLVLYDLSPKQNILNNIIKYKKQLEYSKPYANALAPMVLLKKSDVRDGSLFVNHLDSLQPVDFQCLIYAIYKNNSWLADFLEKCTANIPPLQVFFGNEWVFHCTRPYEIGQNIKNMVENPRPFQHILGCTTDNRVNKKNLITYTNESQQTNSICRKRIDHDQQCIIKTSRLLPKDTQDSKDMSKPGFLPLFKSTCSSVISRCSSVLYKVHNSEDAIIFINTRKYNPLPNSTEELTQDSTASSLDYSKYTEDGFLSITSTSFTRENGLLITKNKKWSI
ncbi:APC membrane recruitment protein 3 [Hyla sarda]|uniref:APC membrane recruitment protein 3 n=1 Tax=Hyla sarda TaxID=327740 RepID=UPI0024C31C77|nr:APC membrane recruitment protein 3 [Hyla sarda]